MKWREVGDDQRSHATAAHRHHPPFDRRIAPVATSCRSLLIFEFLATAPTISSVMPMNAWHLQYRQEIGSLNSCPVTERKTTNWGFKLQVSVVCPVFNTDTALLDAAVASVFAQGTKHDLELILVDDGSTKSATLAALRKAATCHPRVRVLFQERNTGPGQARAAGIAQARYGWIGFIDADDLWPTGKLDQAELAVGMQPDTCWISGDFTMLGADGALQPSKHFVEMPPTTDVTLQLRRIAAPDLTRKLIGAWFPLGASLIRRQAIAAAGGFDHRLRYGEDRLLCLRLSTVTPMDYIRSETYTLRRQGESMMRSTGRMSKQLARCGQLARRDPMLRGVRRELRWYSYACYKDIAMNNALNGWKATGLAFAIRAFLVDPRMTFDLWLFIRLLRRQGDALSLGMRQYSSAEQVILTSKGKEAEATHPANLR